MRGRLASAESARLETERPVIRNFRLRRIQERIASPNERIEPACLRSGPLDPLLLLGREHSVVALRPSTAAMNWRKRFTRRKTVSAWDGSSVGCSASLAKRAKRQQGADAHCAVSVSLAADRP
jgi:hypothetical protein